ncbi:MAG: aldolase [Chloroflexi bacterium]|nr:aldolase [Chloroflexota bacterium]
MLHLSEREQVVEYGKRLILERLTNGTSGNLSIYDPQSDHMIISPSGIPYLETKVEDVVVMEARTAKVVEGSRKPSSEWALHIGFYLAEPSARAVLHTHSAYATTFSCLHEPLRAVHYGIAAAGVETIPVAEYATFGTPALSVNALKAIGRSKAVLLANHGLIGWDVSMPKVFSLIKEVEFMAELQYRALSIGKPIIIDSEEMARVIEKFKTYGQQPEV